MRTQLSFIRVMAVALAILLIPLSAVADCGLKVLQQQWDAKQPDQSSLKSLYDNPIVISLNVNKGWNDSRDNVCDQIKATITKPNAMGKDVNAYNVSCTMADASNLHLHPTGAPNQVRITFTLAGNQLDFVTTTPTVLGSWADPHLHLAYDILVNALVSVQGTSPMLKVVKATATMQNVNLTPVGAIAPALAGMIKAFTGVDLPQKFDQMVSGKQIVLTDRVGQSLETANLLLQPPANNTLAGTWVKHDQLYLVFEPNFAAPSWGSGWLAGVIRWPVQQGHTQTPDCTKIPVVASVPAGAPPVLDPDPPRFGAEPTKQTGSLMLPHPARQAAGMWECDYQVSYLPDGEPASVAIHAAGAQSRGGVLVTVASFAPDGWSGTAVPSGGGKNFKETTNTFGFSTLLAPKSPVLNPGDPAIRQQGVMQQGVIKTGGALPGGQAKR